MSVVREVAAEFVDLPAPVVDAPGPFRYAEPSELLTVLAGSRFAELELSEWRGALPVGGD